MKKVLLTGGSGFVGNAVMDSLLKEPETEIHVLGRSLKEWNSRVYLHKCDLMNYKEVTNAIKNIKPNHLIHLAWNVEHATYLRSSENLLWVGASLNIIKAFVENGGERVFVSGTCFEEITPPSLYAASKSALLQLAGKYCEDMGISFVWGRLFYLFGQGEKNTRVVPYAITELLKGNKVTCKNSKAVRDYMYVMDAGKAIVKTVFSQVEGIVEIASGNTITMGELFQEIGKTVGSQENILLEDNPAFPPVVTAKTDRLHGEVGFNQSTELGKALEQTLSWWRGQVI